MAITTGTTSAPARLIQGRVVLPAGVRKAASIPAEVTLIVRADGEGRLILETPEAIQARVRAAAPGREDGDTVADVRAERDDDIRLSEDAFSRRSAVAAKATQEDADAAGARLLARLGLS